MKNIDGFHIAELAITTAAIILIIILIILSHGNYILNKCMAKIKSGNDSVASDWKWIFSSPSPRDFLDTAYYKEEAKSDIFIRFAITHSYTKDIQTLLTIGLIADQNEKHNIFSVVKCLRFISEGQPVDLASIDNEASSSNLLVSLINNIKREESNILIQNLATNTLKHLKSDL